MVSVTMAVVQHTKVIIGIFIYTAVAQDLLNSCPQ